MKIKSFEFCKFYSIFQISRLNLGESTEMNPFALAGKAGRQMTSSIKSTFILLFIYKIQNAIEIFS